MKSNIPMESHELIITKKDQIDSISEIYKDMYLWISDKNITLYNEDFEIVIPKKAKPKTAKQYCDCKLQWIEQSCLFLFAFPVSKKL